MTPLEDGGYASRKFWLCALTIVLFLAAALIGAGWSSFGALYDQFIMGALGALAIYTGANVVTKHVASAASKKKPKTKTTTAGE